MTDFNEMTIRELYQCVQDLKQFNGLLDNIADLTRRVEALEKMLHVGIDWASGDSFSTIPENAVIANWKAMKPAPDPTCQDCSRVDNCLRSAFGRCFGYQQPPVPPPEIELRWAGSERSKSMRLIVNGRTAAKVYQDCRWHTYDERGILGECGAKYSIDAAKLAAEAAVRRQIAERGWYADEVKKQKGTSNV